MSILEDLVIVQTSLKLTVMVTLPALTPGAVTVTKGAMASFVLGQISKKDDSGPMKQGLDRVWIAERLGRSKSAMEQDWQKMRK